METKRANNNYIPLNQLPYLRISFAFCVGILLNEVIDIHLHFCFSLIATLILLSVFCHFQHYFNLFGISCYVCILILGYTSYKLKLNAAEQSILYKIEDQKITLYGKLIEQPEKVNWYKTIIKLDSLIYERTTFKDQSKVLLYVEPSINFDKALIGSEMKIKVSLAQIEENTNPNTFNYKRFLRHNGVHHFAFVNSDAIITLKNSPTKNIFSYFKGLQKKSVKVLEKYITSAQNADIACALSFGYKDNINKDMNQLYRNTGAAHILAVSGLHVGIIASIITMFLGLISKFNKIPNWFKISTLLTLLVAYTLFTGSSPSVVRAAFMTLIAYVIYIFRSVNYIYNSVGVTSFIMLLYNPFLLFNIGFQFSFLAVLSILFFTKPFMKYFRVKNFLLNIIMQIIIVSCTVQILIAPLIIYYFNQYSLGFLFTNLSSIISAYLIICLSFLILLFEGIQSSLAEFLGFYSNLILEYHHIYLRFIEKKSYLILDQIYINNFSLLMLYISIGLSMLWIYRHSYLRLGILICSIALSFVLLRHDKLQTLEEKNIAFYTSKDPTQIDFIHNGTCYSYIDKTNDENYNNYEKFRISKFVSRVIPLRNLEYYCDNNIIKNGPFIQFGNKIFAINPSTGISSNVDVDYTYFDNKQEINKYIIPKEKRIFNFKATSEYQKMKTDYNLNIKGSLVLRL